MEITFDPIFGMACADKISMLNKFVDASCTFKFNDVDRNGLATLLFLLLAESAIHNKNVRTAFRNCGSIYDKVNRLGILATYYSRSK